MGTTGKHPDGVETYPADQHDLDSYRQAEVDLAKLRIPTLHAGVPPVIPAKPGICNLPLQHAAIRG